MKKIVPRKFKKCYKVMQEVMSCSRKKDMISKFS